MPPHRSIRAGLTAAACALVGVGGGRSAEATGLDASILYWTETSRVSVNELVANLHQPLPRGRSLDLGLAVDVMTGASPTGAVPSRDVQTFTRPSGRGGYAVHPGETPRDDTFQDNRVGLEATLRTPLGRASAGTVGGHYSLEYDYLSLGGHAGLTRDFDRHNTTMALGAAFSWDRLSPKGGIPVPFASMTPPGTDPPRTGSTDHKLVADFQAGVTQVIDRRTVARVNYTLTRSTGYHTDPFKLVSVVDAAGDPVDERFERRPDERTRQSVYGVVRREVAGSVVQASYRYMRDDWRVRSHTAEARWRIAMGAGRYVEPQYRFYHQSAADFFVHFLRAGDPLPRYASADYRLSVFDAHTIAVKVGVPLGGSREVNVRLGYYLQKGDRSPPEAFGSLRGLDLFPALDAAMIQVGYSATLE